MKKSHGMLLRAVFLTMLLGGCATMSHDDIKGAVKKPAPKVEEPAYIFHRVMSGETMSTIAQYYTGKQSMWREIANANPELSPFNLKKDEIVKVPRAIATVHKEQPAYSTARKKRAGPKKGSAETTAPSSVEEALEGDEEPVFGPK
jgi:LysM repeat protein